MELKPARVFEQFAKINQGRQDRQRAYYQTCNQGYGKCTHNHTAKPYRHGLRQARRLGFRLP